MKSVKPIVGVILVFMFGAASGSLTTYMVSRSNCEIFAGAPRNSREEMLIKRLTRQLDLDTQQQERVETIIHETHGKIRQIHQHAHPAIEALLTDSQKRISALLRPDQQQHFQKIIEERKAHRQMKKR
jgi:hypothetical protein